MAVISSSTSFLSNTSLNIGGSDQQKSTEITAATESVSSGQGLPKFAPTSRSAHPGLRRISSAQNKDMPDSPKEQGGLSAGGQAPKEVSKVNDNSQFAVFLPALPPGKNTISPADSSAQPPQGIGAPSNVGTSSAIQIPGWKAITSHDGKITFLSMAVSSPAVVGELFEVAKHLAEAHERWSNNAVKKWDDAYQRIVSQGDLIVKISSNFRNKAKAEWNQREKKFVLTINPNIHYLDNVQPPKSTDEKGAA